jgi:hypothetical protein
MVVEVGGKTCPFKLVDRTTAHVDGPALPEGFYNIDIFLPGTPHRFSLVNMLTYHDLGPQVTSHAEAAPI